MELNLTESRGRGTRSLKITLMKQDFERENTLQRIQSSVEKLFGIGNWTTTVIMNHAGHNSDLLTIEESETTGALKKAVTKLYNDFAKETEASRNAAQDLRSREEELMNARSGFACGKER